MPSSLFPLIYHHYVLNFLLALYYSITTNPQKFGAGFNLCLLISYHTLALYHSSFGANKCTILRKGLSIIIALCRKFESICSFGKSIRFIKKRKSACGERNTDIRWLSDIGCRITGNAKRRAEYIKSFNNNDQIICNIDIIVC